MIGVKENNLTLSTCEALRPALISPPTLNCRMQGDPKQT